jgi:hypothetical protein
MCAVFAPERAFSAVTDLPPVVKLTPRQDKDITQPVAVKKLPGKVIKQPPSENERVAIAEQRANFNECIDGRYPALCKHDLLTDEQQAKVEVAEKTANFHRCIDGRYPALCKHSWLTVEQSGQVLAAEKRENLRVCLDGRYQALCNHPLLNQADGTKASNADKGRAK